MVPPALRFVVVIRSGVGSAVHYARALTQQPAYADFVTAACPQAEAWAAECVSVPCYPELPDAVVERMAGVLRAHAREAAALA